MRRQMIWSRLSVFSSGRLSFSGSDEPKLTLDSAAELYDRVATSSAGTETLFALPLFNGGVSFIQRFLMPA
jgi:hypothetical protein